jgi:XTP/dITP diphosphohydrolase
MQRILLCTGNTGKVEELRALLHGHVELLSLLQVGLSGELPETGETLQANALQKARFAHQRTGIPCLADDTGLEVEALNGAPGVYSARYAGEARNAAANMAKLLTELADVAHRKARFRTVLALVDGDRELLFEGTVEGVITTTLLGEGGFGYDPVFRPEGHELTFAQMDRTTKNSISHRGRALRKFLDHFAAAR